MQLSQADGPCPFVDGAGGVILTGVSVLVLGEALKYRLIKNSYPKVE